MSELYTVIHQDTETAFTDRGVPVEKIRVQFKVGEFGPFFMRFEKDGFSGALAKIELEKFAREILALKGA